MKKLLTIICALSLILAFSMPAAAIDDIDPNVAVGDYNAQASDHTDQNINTGTIDNSETLSGKAQDAKYAAMDNGQNGDNINTDNSDNSTSLTDSQNTDASVTTNTTTNTDASNWQQDNSSADNNSDNSQDNDNYTATLTDQSQDNDTFTATDNSDQGNTDVKVKVHDINVSDVANDKSDDDLLDNKGGTIEVSDIANDKSQDNDDNDLLDNKGGTIEVSDIANDKSQDNDDNSTNDSYNTDNSINTDNSTDDDVAVDVAFDDVVDMKGNDAAAAFGGTAIALDIGDIELTLANTTSVSGIYQEQGDWSGMTSGADATGRGDDEADSFSGFLSECHSVNADVYDNIGIIGATFSAGHFNNQANLNSVNVTVQY